MEINTLKGKAIYKKIEPKIKDARGKIIAIEVKEGANPCYR